MKKTLLLSLLILLYFTIPAYAVGIMGHDLAIKMDFVPGLEKTFDYYLLTTSGITQDYKVYAKGTLKDYVTLEPNILKNIPQGAEPRIRATLHLPDKLQKPGINTLYICVEETVSGNSQITALSAACARIEVRVLFPGKYLVATLNAPSVNLNELVNCEITLSNWGKEKIQNARANITIFDNNNNSLETIYTGATSVEPAKDSKLYALFDTTGHPPGEYKAKAIIIWDNNKTTVSDVFRVGSMSIDIIDYTKEFINGTINPLEIKIRSDWNNPIPEAYATIKIGSTELKTPSVYLKPWETKILKTYWDTNRINVGEYNAKITIHYPDGTTEKDVKFKVIKKIEPVKKEPISITTIVLIALIIILIIANLFWLFYIKRKKENEAQETKT